MGKIIIIGAGAMGTAFGYPCSDNKHEVNIIGTHLENKAIDELNKNRFHPGLNLEVTKSIKFFLIGFNRIFFINFDFINTYTSIFYHSSYFRF